MPFGMDSFADMTLSNAADIVFLAATVPVLLRVNHEHNGRTDSDDGNRGKATFGCVSPKNVTVLPISESCKIPPALLRTPLRRNC
jgi:hypothetical protein